MNAEDVTVAAILLLIIKELIAVVKEFVSKKNGNGRKGDFCPFADDHTFIIDAIRELKNVFLQDHAFIKESIKEVQRAVERLADEGKRRV